MRLIITPPSTDTVLFLCLVVQGGHRVTGAGGAPPHQAHPFLLRSDNGLVFTSRSYTALVKSYGLQQEFITPYSPEQNGMVERVIRTLKDQCVHRHRFETLQHASRVIADWIGFWQWA